MIKFDQYLKMYRLNTILSALCFLTGCSTPADQARTGNIEPLMELVRSGKAGVNDQLVVYRDSTSTPLCAVLNTSKGGAALDELLSRGADVNQRCFGETSSSLDLPLDFVLDRIGEYRANNIQEEKVSVLLGYTKRLLAAGAVSKDGPLTEVQFKKKISRSQADYNEYERQRLAIVAELEAKAKRERRAFTDALTTVVVAGAQVAGATAQNYAQAKQTQSLNPPPSNNIYADSQRAVDAERAEIDRRIAASRQQQTAKQSTQVASSPTATGNRTAPANASSSNLELPKYQPQVATISSVRNECPPGSSPARHANGQYVTIPPSAYCIKDTQSASGMQTEKSRNGATADSATTRQPSANKRNADNDGSSMGDSDSKNKKTMWGPIKLEAIAICNQSPKNGKWQCYGPVQNEPFHDSPSLESALRGQQCAGGIFAAGGPVLDGVQWNAYRCGHSLGYGDNDVAKRYSLVTARRSYICPADQLGDGRCTTLYDGQDK